MGDGIVFLGDDGAADGSQPGAAASTEALRVRAADALERALAFVDAHGDSGARRLVRVVLRAEPSSVWEMHEGEQQRADGALAMRPSTAFGLLGREFGAACAGDAAVATALGLVWLADARALHGPTGTRAVRFLEATQRDDGSFGEQALPEELRIVATALAGGAMARTRVVRPECLAGAGDYLVRRWDPDRVEGAGLGPLLAWSHYFTNAPHDDSDEILQWCGRELEKGFRSGVREALPTVRVLSVCDVAAVPGSAIAPSDLLTALLAEQASDGGFDALAPEGPPGRAVPTIEAMRGLIGTCAGLDE